MHALYYILMLPTLFWIIGVGLTFLLGGRPGLVILIDDVVSLLGYVQRWLDGG